jgi:hypothetical protein
MPHAHRPLCPRLPLLARSLVWWPLLLAACTGQPDTERSGPETAATVPVASLPVSPATPAGDTLELSMYNLPYRWAWRRDGPDTVRVLLTRGPDTVWRETLSAASLRAHGPDSLWAAPADARLIGLRYAFVRTDRLYMTALLLGPGPADTLRVLTTLRYLGPEAGTWWTGMF